jgi:hypothetical protein
MLTKQMRELERQAQVVNQNKEYMIQLSDLMFDEYNGMYYVGNIVDMDGSDWVNKDMAQQILDQLNVDWMS